MKSNHTKPIEVIAEEKYPFMEQSATAGRDGMLFNERQKLKREAFIFGSQYGKEDQDNFAISFAVWAMFHPDSKALQAAGATASQLLEKYKDRPFIDNNTANQ